MKERKLQSLWLVLTESLPFTRARQLEERKLHLYLSYQAPLLTEKKMRFFGIFNFKIYCLARKIGKRQTI